jgi:hypothetical protein
MRVLNEAAVNGKVDTLSTAFPCPGARSRS